jgi:hypothetical protein
LKNKASTANVKQFQISTPVDDHADNGSKETTYIPNKNGSKEISASKYDKSASKSSFFANIEKEA